MTTRNSRLTLHLPLIEAGADSEHLDQFADPIAQPPGEYVDWYLRRAAMERREAQEIFRLVQAGMVEGDVDSQRALEALVNAPEEADDTCLADEVRSPYTSRIPCAGQTLKRWLAEGFLTRKHFTDATGDPYAAFASWDDQAVREFRTRARNIGDLQDKWLSTVSSAASRHRSKRHLAVRNPIDS
ncbi:MAG: hypothetical protein P8J88_07035 [Phycisphaerales bacterium]|nr:hypothetical protein [Phycisphaerales bacterium]